MSLKGIEHYRWFPGGQRLRVRWLPGSDEGEVLEDTEGGFVYPPPIAGGTLEAIARYLHLSVAEGFRITREQASLPVWPYRELGMTVEEGELPEVIGAVLYDDRLRPFRAEASTLAAQHLTGGTPRLLFRSAMVRGAPHLLTFHLGRPDPTPTDGDWGYVQGCEDLGYLCQVGVLDHLLLSDEGDWVSLRDWPHRDWPEPSPSIFTPSYPKVTTPRLPSETSGSRLDRVRLRKVQAAYRHPATGETWAGRGERPRWLREELAAGRSLEEFRAEEE